LIASDSLPALPQTDHKGVLVFYRFPCDALPYDSGGKHGGEKGTDVDDQQQSYIADSQQRPGQNRGEQIPGAPGEAH